MRRVFLVTKDKICHFMIYTLQKLYNTVKILYKYNHINYIKKIHRGLQASPTLLVQAQLPIARKIKNSSIGSEPQYMNNAQMKMLEHILTIISSNKARTIYHQTYVTCLLQTVGTRSTSKRKRKNLSHQHIEVGNCLCSNASNPVRSSRLE
jgi:hypothetical protein